MSNDTKPKKQLYHSELVGMGSILVEVLSGVLQSKFDKSKEYVELRIDGNLRHYVIENPTCKERVSGMKGRKVMLKATGSRDEADIEIAGATVPQGQQAQPTQQAAPQETEKQRAPAPKDPAHGSDHENFKAIKQEANRLANLYLVAREAANYIQRETKALEKNEAALSADAHERVATALFIQLCRNGKDGLMPTGSYTDLKSK